MAKGLRASTRKKNNSALRDRLFGPAADARTERLSAKLQELAAKPRPDDERAMDVNQKTESENTTNQSKENEMELDALGARIKPFQRRSKKQNLGRTQKKVVKRKARNSVVFPDIKAKWRRQNAEKRKK